MRRSLIALIALVGCAGPDVAPPIVPASPLVVADAGVDGPADVSVSDPDPAPGPVPEAEVWLRGSTHVHARPSGDSSEPIAGVIAWYERHGYDFIALSDHNQVSEVDPKADTHGRVAVRAPATGLIVLAASELTHNPSNCIPAGDKSKKCRIHVNALGVTARPKGKIDWANRKTHDRILKYQAAIDVAKALGASLLQINHPQWFWGMTPEVLIELVHRGFRLFEIANAQFTVWNAGDATHLSTEALWDAVLVTGATVWGVASDDAHDYHDVGKWKAGGGWVVVKARRDPQAILDALGAGHFYSSNGVVLDRAEVTGDELVVEVAAGEPGTYAIDFVEAGRVVETVPGKTARRAVPATGYVRAVVRRDDGKRAWVQPARR